MESHYPPMCRLRRRQQSPRPMEKETFRSSFLSGAQGMTSLPEYTRLPSSCVYFKPEFG